MFKNLPEQYNECLKSILNQFESFKKDVFITKNRKDKPFKIKQKQEDVIAEIGMYNIVFKNMIKYKNKIKNFFNDYQNEEEIENFNLKKYIFKLFLKLKFGFMLENKEFYINFNRYNLIYQNEKFIDDKKIFLEDLLSFIGRIIGISVEKNKELLIDFLDNFSEIEEKDIFCKFIYKNFNQIFKILVNKKNSKILIYDINKKSFFTKEKIKDENIKFILEKNFFLNKELEITCPFRNFIFIKDKEKENLKIYHKQKEIMLFEEIKNLEFYSNEKNENIFMIFCNSNNKEKNEKKYFNINKNGIIKEVYLENKIITKERNYHGKGNISFINNHTGFKLNKIIENYHYKIKKNKIFKFKSFVCDNYEIYDDYSLLVYKNNLYLLHKNSEFMINFDSKKIIKNLEKVKEENEMCKMEINL